MKSEPAEWINIVKYKDFIIEELIMEVKHGLPEKVIFCKRCVISNQRPNTSPEYRKKDSKIKTIGFGEDGICDTCRYYELKKKIDWKEREKQLLELLDRHRRNDGRFDVVVPGSGGKDSFLVAHILKFKYNMHPLTVTWAPHIYTDIGWKNFQNWLRAGFDNVLITPNPQVHRILTRLAFENLVNPFQPFIIGQKNVAPRTAVQYEIPLIIYGENQAEAHNSLEDNLSPLMGIEHFTRSSEKDELYFGGVALEDLEAYGISNHDMYLYIPLLEEDVKKINMEVHFMSYYHNWSPQDHYYYAKKHSKFECNPDGRSEGTYTKFASLDDKIDGQHYYTTYIKFGQARAAHDACRDIRDGYITREEALSLVKKYDGEFPNKYFKEVLEYMQISDERYWEVIDNARSPHLWEKDHGNWKLKHAVYY
jgi:N-acetyl sugar amidotransferase